jgi:hypothetical protein
MRARLANTPPSEIARNYLNYYAKRDPKIAATAEPSFEDDPQTNVIVTVEHYEIADFWTEGEREMTADAIDGHLDRPRIVLRKMPLAKSYPLLVAHHTRVRFPKPPAIATDATDLADGAVRFHASQSVVGCILFLDYRYEALSDFVPPDKVAAHLELLEKIRRAATFTLDSTVTEGKRTRFSWDSASILGAGILGVVGVALVVVVVAVGFAMRPWLRRRAFRRRSRPKAGEAASNPIAVRNEAEMASRLGRMRCACRGRIAIVEGSPAGDRLIMGSRPVWALRGTCGTCGATRSVYFEVRVRRSRAGDRT